MRPTLRQSEATTYHRQRERVEYRAAATQLDRLFREAVFSLREDIKAPLGAANRMPFSDLLRDRPIGTRTLARIAVVALAAGAPATSLLRLSAAFEGWLLSLQPEIVCFRQAALEETKEQGEADRAVLDAAFEQGASRPKVEEAIAQTMDHLAAQRRLLASLVATLEQLERAA